MYLLIAFCFLLLWFCIVYLKHVKQHDLNVYAYDSARAHSPRTKWNRVWFQTIIWFCFIATIFRQFRFFASKKFQQRLLLIAHCHYVFFMSMIESLRGLSCYFFWYISRLGVRTFHVDIYMHHVSCKSSNFFMLDHDSLQFSGRLWMHQSSDENFAE